MIESYGSRQAGRIIRQTGIVQLMPNSSATTRQVLARVRAHLPSLQSADARVAQVLLEQPNLVIYKSAAEVAEMANTSGATVVRCAQKVGFKGFHDLKIALAQELAAIPSPVAVGDEHHDPDTAVLLQVTAAGAESVRDAAALVDPAVFHATVAALDQARRVLFVGVGTSAPLCQDAAYRFTAIGLLADAPADVHVQHVNARLLGSEDVCVTVSHTGSTRETLEITRAAASAGATTVAITSFAKSALTELVDHAIVAGTREVAFQLEAMASRLAHLALLDSLLVAVAARDSGRAQAALRCYSDVLSEHRL
jgi:RpiR family carbohydrate utilization transcriptional regulator